MVFIGFLYGIHARARPKMWNESGTLAHEIVFKDQPCLCLWLLFLEQMTMTLPLRLMTLHLSHIGFTDGLTFILISSENILSHLSAAAEKSWRSPARG